MFVTLNIPSTAAALHRACGCAVAERLDVMVNDGNLLI
jgi:hypothetical protein